MRIENLPARYATGVKKEEVIGTKKELINLISCYLHYLQCGTYSSIEDELNKAFDNLEINMYKLIRIESEENLPILYELTAKNDGYYILREI